MAFSWAGRAASNPARPLAIRPRHTHGPAKARTVARPAPAETPVTTITWVGLGASLGLVIALPILWLTY